MATEFNRPTKPIWIRQNDRTSRPINFDMTVAMRPGIPASRECNVDVATKPQMRDMAIGLD